MAQFIQLHLLTGYAPSNLNRDDLGRPKTAVFGGTQRLRVSSQSIKRAWRTSDRFQKALEGHIGARTQRLGENFYGRLVEGGLSEAEAFALATLVAGCFGKPKKKEEALRIEQLVHVGVEEQQRVDDLAERLLKDRAFRDELLPHALAARKEAGGKEEGGGKAPRGRGKKDGGFDVASLQRDLLGRVEQTVDIALFGRMLAAVPEYGVDGAVQVSHPLSVHRVVVEDDFFTAVDDLKQREEDVGAGMLGTAEFAASLLYTYVCIDFDRLVANLGGNTTLARQAVSALTEAATMVSPGAKQNSYGSRAYASYCLAERGDQQPRSLAMAYLQDVRGEDLLLQAITRLEQEKSRMDRVYGPCADARYCLSVPQEEGTLQGLLAFVRG